MKHKIVYTLAGIVAAVAIVAVAFAGLHGVAHATSLSGAIFTTNSSGSQVNGNIYDNKTDVYLNGGPLNCHAGSGLPDGTYYFQVTDPSGGTLLSDVGPNNGTITVSGGVFSAYSGSHATGTGACGGISVQLAPFNDTPNPGGEYKVWVTPTGSYSDGNGTFGFLSDQSKTDNFQIKVNIVPENIQITGYKFYDANVDGVQDNGEPTIDGWRINLTDGVTNFLYTGPNGTYTFTVPANSGDYTVSEVMANGTWHNTTPTSGTVTAGSSDAPGPIFGNVCVGQRGGLTLGYWSNKNGQAALTTYDFAGGGSTSYALNLEPFYTNTWFNLTNGFGTTFTLEKSNLKNYLLNATATDMRYMLSAQTATMMLNVNHGVVGDGWIIYLGTGTGVPGVDSNGFISIHTLIADAIAALGTTDRTTQEAIKTALDRANNNTAFYVQPSPCAFTTPY